MAPSDLGLTRDDEIFPLFIIEALPAGLSGLLLAGILAAAMYTLSSSLSALSSSTVTDVVGRLRRAPMTDERSEEHTSELQSRGHLVCRLLLEKKNVIIRHGL